MDFLLILNFRPQIGKINKTTGKNGFDEILLIFGATITLIMYDTFFNTL